MADPKQICIPSSSAPPEPPPSGSDGTNVVVRGKKLTSKNLKIISKDLFFSPLENSEDLFRTPEFANGFNFDSFYIQKSDQEYFQKQNNSPAKTVTSTANPPEIIFSGSSALDFSTLNRLLSGSISKEFEYINFNLEVPFTKQEIEDNETPDYTVFDYEFVYNYKLAKYEELVGKLSAEWGIPNAQVFFFLRDSLTDADVLSFDQLYLRLLSYGRADGKLRPLLSSGRVGLDRYLEEYYGNIPASKIDTEFSILDRAKNYVVTQDDIVEYNRLSESFKGTRNYGFYLSFPYEYPDPTIFDKIEDFDYFKKVLKKTNTDLILYDYFNRNTGSAEEYVTEISYTRLSQFNTPLNGITDIRKQKFKTWDMTNFFKDYQNNLNTKNFPKSIIDNKNLTIIGESSEAAQKYKNNNTFKIFQILMTSAANAGFKNLVEKEEIGNQSVFVNTSDTPHEVIFYKIEKSHKDTGQVLQTFLLPNPVEEDKISTQRKFITFFDSQVKIDKEYNYEVYAVALVLGKKYKYKDFKLASVPSSGLAASIPKGTEGLFDKSRSTYIAITAEVKDYIPLIQVPLFEVSGQVISNPPVSPEVKFSGIKGRNNRIIIDLKSSFEEVEELPIPLNSDEAEYFAKLAKSKGKKQGDKLLFKTDDYDSFFQIFRSEEKPTSYTDFNQKLRKEINLGGKYSGITTFDSLEANKKYYYIFRAIDERGNISNPSPVYEVTVNDYDGYILPEFKIVELEDKSFYEYSKTFRKYVEISPTFDNVIIDDQITEKYKSAFDIKDKNNFPMGAQGSKTWGRKFKVRITSKSSGKKIDVNFDFTKKFIPPADKTK